MPPAGRQTHCALLILARRRRRIGARRPVLAPGPCAQAQCRPAIGDCASSARALAGLPGRGKPSAFQHSALAATPVSHRNLCTLYNVCYVLYENRLVAIFCHAVKRSVEPRAAAARLVGRLGGAWCLPATPAASHAPVWRDVGPAEFRAHNRGRKGRRRGGIRQNGNCWHFGREGHWRAPPICGILYPRTAVFRPPPSRHPPGKAP